MKTKLIIHDNNPIIVSDEEIKEGDWFNRKGKYYVLRFDPGNSEYWTVSGKKVYASSSQKIIAGLDNLPEIDFNGSEEDFGWVDVEKFAKEKYEYFSKNLPRTIITPKDKIEGFIDGFKKAQSLNEKKFTLDDLRNAFRAGRNNGENKTELNVNDFIQSLQQPKSWNVKVEMNKDYVKIVEIVDLELKKKVREKAKSLGFSTSSYKRN